MSKSVNIVITNVSTVWVDNKTGLLRETRYKDERAHDYIGFQTNEAPIKSILKNLEEDQQKLDRVIYIESDLVRRTIKSNDSSTVGFTHAAFLRNNINTFADENHFSRPKYDEYNDSIKIKDEPSEADVSETVFMVYERIRSLIPDDGELNLYVEANGGVRYVLTMLLAVARTFENLNDNVHIRQVTSMVRRDDDPNSRIADTKAIYDTAQITGIVDEFLNYGRITGLKQYMEAHTEDLDESIRADIDAVADRLSRTSEDIQLCRTAGMLEDFYGNDNIKKTIVSFIRKYDDSQVPAVRVFRYVLDALLTDLDRSIYSPANPDPSVDAVSGAAVPLVTPELSVDGTCKTPILYLPRLIRWCLNKSFIQQALTFCSERMPEYLMASGRIGLSDEMKESLRDLRAKDKDGAVYEESYYLISRLRGVTEKPVNNALNRNFIAPVIRKIKEEPRSSGGFLENTNWDNAFLSDHSLSNYPKTDEKRTLTAGAIEVDEEKIRTEEAIEADKEKTRIAGAVLDFAEEYCSLEGEEGGRHGGSSLTEAKLEDLLEKHGFRKSVLKVYSRVSAKYTLTLSQILRGVCLDKEGVNEVPYTHLNDPCSRLEKALPELILSRFLEPVDVEEMYGKMLEELFPDDSSSEKPPQEDSSREKPSPENQGTCKPPALWKKLYGHFGKSQSAKYNIYRVWKAGLIISPLRGTYEEVQRLLYLYSLCKEQRNFSNHAHVSDADRDIALNAERLTIVIDALLKQCGEVG